MAEQLPSKLPGLVKKEFEDTVKRRFFFGLGFDCYGGVAGLLDWGPVGCQVKNNFVSLWRHHFVLEENMLEVDTTNLTPEEVFIASGHTQKFNDVMVGDSVNGELKRMDKFLEEYCEHRLTDPKTKDKLTPEQVLELKKLIIDAEGMNVAEFKAVIDKWNIKSAAGNPLDDPQNFNLMFMTQVGPGKGSPAYLRPELAQGIILNFNRLLEFNGGKMPFAGACIGTAYRNEIAPRNGLMRVREFALAEIEHFLNPNDKSFPKLYTTPIVDEKLWFWTKEHQEANPALEPEQMTLREALEKKIINNETLAYFMGRSAMFCHLIGIKYMRFRQHKSTEMAHYAVDCWDIECLTSDGFKECIGIADRSCYDLEKHAKERNTNFFAYEKFDVVQTQTVFEKKVNKGAINKSEALKRDDAKVMREIKQKVTVYLETLEEDAAKKMDEDFKAGTPVVVDLGGEQVTIDKSMVSFASVEKKISGRNYTPSVIEPSFGIGRLIYALLEQNYWIRKDEPVADAPAEPVEKEKKKGKQSKEDKNEKRAVFSLPARIAPFKCSVLPLSPAVARMEYAQKIMAKWRQDFSAMGITYKVDDGSQGIGKKYARSDEIGIPYDLTIDGDTQTTNKVTLRERDSTKQVYTTVEEAPEILRDLCQDRLTWDQVLAKYPVKE